MAEMSERSLPQMSALTPHLVVDGGAKAIDFYGRAFGAEEMTRLAGPDGRLMNACLRIGGQTLMLVDAMPERGVVSPKALGGAAVTLHLTVPDVDAAFARAVAAGATVTMPVADMFWGDRYGMLTDPFGHSWSIATHQRDVTVGEMQAAMAQMSPECGAAA